MTNKKYHYTYYSYEEWGMGYFGSRSCDCLPEEDVNYFGSYTHKNFNPTYKIILKGDYSTRKDAIRDEVILHNYYNVSANPHFANRAKQTSTRFTQAGVSPSEETRRKIGKGNKGKLVTEQTRKKQSIISKNRPLHINFIKGAIEYNAKYNRGIPKSKECRKKISESLKGRFEKEDNSFYGKRHTEESIKKMKESLKNAKRPETTPYKNSIWITDGVISRRLQNGLEIPEGWWKGRIHKKNIYPKYSR